ncbi:T4 beta protein [Celeribacter halophilus]|uniref:Beta protein n=2 Tax=Celeribacter halophilus TaxID=576117 RepID=A0A1I3XGQ4_9RHOB|nr:T4 beta protein [Celeribacter halophilus]SFK18529.1 Beta protein [Celeribacter halophilus]
MVSVHCEITRGRKKPNKDKTAPFEYNIDKVFDTIKQDFLNAKICVIDITREPTLRSTETESLGQPHNGYEKWVNTVNNLYTDNPKVRPTLIINPQETDDYDTFQSDVFAQFDSFSQTFDLISYRASVLHDDGFVDDIAMLSDRANDFIAQGNTFEVLLDFEYIQPSTADLHASYIAPIIREIREAIPAARIVCVGTSFPKNVTDLGDEERDEFRLEEFQLHAEINRTQNQFIEYGDYGSINPIRNDFSPPVGIHLRARIDFPTETNTIFYYRVAPKIDKDRNILLSPRVTMYKDAAKRVYSDAAFTPIEDSWGCKKIIEAATKSPEGKSPNFWISVRMEIHICRRTDILSKITQN